VIDFGVARVPAFHRTQTAILFGTPKYMPPEQLLAKQLDGRVDIYALGVILYEALAGTAPIEAPTAGDYLRRNIEQPPVPLRERCPELPAELEGLLQRMLAKRPEDRPTSMADVALRLQAVGVAAGWLAAADQPPGGIAAAETAVHTAVALEAVTGELAPAPAEATGGATAAEAPPTPAPSVPTASLLATVRLARSWLVVAGLLGAAAIGAAVYLVAGGSRSSNPSGPRWRQTPGPRAAADAGPRVDHSRAVIDAASLDASVGEIAGDASPRERRRGSRRRGGWRKVTGGL
jgi:hypothetical protein